MTRKKVLFAHWENSSEMDKELSWEMDKELPLISNIHKHFCIILEKDHELTVFWNEPGLRDPLLSPLFQGCG